MKPNATILAGLCATLLGVGLQRFAYAPLVPAMVQAQWLSADAAGLLGAANFAGYLIGAALAPSVGRSLGMRAALRLAMLVATSCFLLCAWRGQLVWFLPWRLLAGIAGGVLMVLAGPAVQQAVPPAMRGRAGGTMFIGPGGGIVVGAVVVPALLPAGLPAAWLALGAVGAILMALSWPRWPDVPPPPRVAWPAWRGGTGALVASYTLGAAAATPHMGWWPDFVTRGLNHGTATGAAFWALYGLSAMIGPTLFGWMADRIGAARTFQLIMWVQVPALLLPLLSTALPVLALSSLLGGATTLGATVVALIRGRELAGDGAPAVWRICTIGWAAAQTAAGFGLAALYRDTGSHLPLFAAGLAAAVAAALLAGVGQGAVVSGTGASQ